MLDSVLLEFGVVESCLAQCTAAIGWPDSDPGSITIFRVNVEVSVVLVLGR